MPPRTSSTTNTVVWRSADRRYALDSRHVVEVVPVVDVRRVDHAEDWLRGLFDYRGELIPLVDFGALLGLAPLVPRRCSRVLVVRLADGPEGQSPPLGLLVERLLGVQALDFEDAHAHPGLDLPGAAFLGPIARSAAGSVQRVEAGALLDAGQRAILFRRGSHGGSAGP